MGSAAAANEMPKKNMRPMTWVTLDPQRLHQIRTFHTENPLAGRCRAFVLDGLFSGDFTVMDSNGYTLNFTASYNKFFQRRYKEFSYDAYDAYMTLGFVPMLLVQHASGHWYPVVPKYGTYMIQVAYKLDNERMYYRIWRPKALKIYIDGGDRNSQNAMSLFGGIRNGRTQTNFTSYSNTATGRSYENFMHTNGDCNGIGGDWIIDDSMSVITGLGYDPGIMGEIHSPLASIIKESELTMTLEYYLKMAEHQMTHPPLTMQYHLTEDPDDFSEYNKEMGGANYNPNTAFQDSDEHQTANLAAKELRKVHQFTKYLQADAVLQATGGLRDEASPADKLAVVGSTTVIPKGLQHVKNDSNITQVGDKYHAQKMLLDDQISGLYGIPLPLLRNVGALRGNIAGQNDIFRNTLIKHARMLGNICTTAFCDVYMRSSSDSFDTMFGCKAVVDDTEFVSYGVKRARESGMEVIEDASSKMATAPSLNTVIIKDGHTSDAPDPGIIKPDTESIAIAKLIAENAALKKANKRLQRGGKGAKNKAGTQSSAASTSKAGSSASQSKAPAGTAKEFEVDSTEASHLDYNVMLSVSHLMNDKMLQYGHQIGAYGLTTLQNMMLNRLGFPSSMYKTEMTTAEQMVDAALRDPSAEAPREDSTLPEGQGLEAFGNASKKVVSSGLLLELAQAGGVVEKMKANRREAEMRVKEKAREEAGTASKRKRSRDGVDRKGDVKGKPLAKKAKKK